MSSDFLSLKKSDYRTLLEINEILADVDRQTLVIFDLDYTLFRSTQNIGMPEWIHHFVNNEINKGTSKIEAFQKWYPVWLKAQEVIDVEVMDPMIHNILSYLGKNSAGVIGLTARGSESAEITEKQLSKLCLKINQTSISNFPIEFDFEVPVLLNNGILYAHEFNDKGTVFVEWFLKIQKLVSNEYTCNKIIFIDDSDKNVHSLAEAARVLNLNYIGFHYPISDVFKAKFDQKIAEKEALILLNSTSNSEAKNTILALHIEENLIT